MADRDKMEREIKWFKWSLVIAFITIWSSLFAQTSKDQLWVSPSFNYYLKSTISINTDISHRLRISDQAPVAKTFRTAIHFHGQRISYAFGSAFFINYKLESGEAFNEFRPHQQMVWEKSFGGFKIRTRLRIEERFRNQQPGAFKMGNDYIFNMRYRLQAGFSYSWEKLKVTLADEIMYSHSFKGLDKFMMDQNRTSLGIAYQLTPKLELAHFYMPVLRKNAESDIDITPVNYFQLNYTIR